MGTTGSGKSSFINQFHTNQPVVIGQGLESCACTDPSPSVAECTDSNTGTHEVDAYRCQDEELGTFWLIDTPGFGDTYRSDSEVLGDIANWLNKAYLSEIKLTGIIYVHAIREAWISRKATNSIQYFTRLCGPNALRKVVLVSTFWDTVDPSAGESREQELKNNPEYWADMIDRGSKAFRHYNSRSTARAVVRHLLNISTANDRGTYLTIQQEMVEQEKKLDETAAGIFMLEALRIHVLRKFKILGRSHSNVRDSLWR
jgi:septin family protein